MSNTINICLGHKPFSLENQSFIDLMISPVQLMSGSHVAWLDDSSYGEHGHSLSEYAQLLWVYNNLDKIARDVEYIRIFHYRRFVARHQLNHGSPSDNAFWITTMREDDVKHYAHEFDRNADSELFNTGVNFGVGGVLLHYLQFHVLEDILRFANFLFEQKILSGEDVVKFLNTDSLIPACNIGIFHKSTFKEVYGKLMEAAKFMDSFEYIPRKDYQRRNMGFLLERLQSFILLQRIEMGLSEKKHGQHIVISDSTFISQTDYMGGGVEKNSTLLDVRRKKEIPILRYFKWFR